MTSRRRCGAHWFGLRRESVAIRPTRLIAATLLLLVALPFTEPFSVCTPAVLLHPPVAAAARPLPVSGALKAPSLKASSHEIGYPPLSLTDDQLRDAKDVVLAPEFGLAAEASAFAVLAEGPDARPPAWQPAALILRI